MECTEEQALLEAIEVHLYPVLQKPGRERRACSRVQLFATEHLRQRLIGKGRTTKDIPQLIGVLDECTAVCLKRKAAGRAAVDGHALINLLERHDKTCRALAFRAIGRLRRFLVGLFHIVFSSTPVKCEARPLPVCFFSLFLARSSSTTGGVGRPEWSAKSCSGVL